VTLGTKARLARFESLDQVPGDRKLELSQEFGRILQAARESLRTVDVDPERREEIDGIGAKILVPPIRIEELERSLQRLAKAAAMSPALVSFVCLHHI
jgi:hypothetical protein